MAEDFIEEIYSKSMKLMELNLLIEMARQRREHGFVLKLNEMLPILGDIAKEWVKQDYENGIDLWNKLEMTSSMSGDLIALGDHLEREILPRYQKYIDRYCNICVDDGNGLCIKSSSSAFLTLINTDNNMFIHSGENPMWEAYIQAKMMYTPEIRDYYILGAGLGYLPYQLYLLSKGTANIHIFEPYPTFVEYAKAYGVLDWIPSHLLIIDTSDSLISFYTAIQSGKGYFVSDAVINYIKEEEKSVLFDLIVYENTNREYGHDMQLNCCINLNKIHRMIDEYESSKNNNKFVIVAAGPSLDEYIDYLRDIQYEKTIISVGTVLGKLLKNGIRPTAVVVADPQERTFSQVSEYCDEDIPMFIGSSANHLFADQYNGEKYLVPTDAIVDIARNLDIIVPEKTFFCGSTVTTMSVRCAIILGAKEIELIGVDLAYPGEKTHALGTMDCKQVNRKGMIPVENVHGGTVFTSLEFQQYIRELESIVSENGGIQFYNLSKSGARIRGTKIL